MLDVVRGQLSIGMRAWMATTRTRRPRRRPGTRSSHRSARGSPDRPRSYVPKPRNYDSDGRVDKTVLNCTSSGTTAPTTDWASCTAAGTEDGTFNFVTGVAPFSWTVGG